MGRGIRSCLQLTSPTKRIGLGLMPENTGEPRCLRRSLFERLPWASLVAWRYRPRAAVQQKNAATAPRDIDSI
jgi:hypothetical protein